MPTEVELVAEKIIEINDFGAVNGNQQQEILHTCHNVRELNSANEALAVDFTIHILHHYRDPNAPLRLKLEDFLLNKIRFHSDMTVSMVLASRVLFESMGPLSAFQNEVLGFVADNLPRFNRMHNVSPLTPNLLVQIFSRPRANERQMSAALLRDGLTKMAEVNPLQTSIALRQVMDCSVVMANPAEQAIVTLGHQIQPAVSAQSVREGALLALRVGLHSRQGSIQQRVAIVRAMEAIEREPGKPDTYASSITMKAPAGYTSVESAQPAVESDLNSPIWLASALIRQGLAANEAPYQRLTRYLHLMLPTMPPHQQHMFLPLLAGQENGVLRDPTHPLRGHTKAHAVLMTAKSYHAYLSIQKPALAEFMPRLFRVGQGIEPA